MNNFNPLQRPSAPFLVLSLKLLVFFSIYAPTNTINYTTMINNYKKSFPFSAPPSSIEIQGYTHSSKVEVRENQDLTLTCIVANSKPAADIKWYRGHVEYKPGIQIFTMCLYLHFSAIEHII